MVFVYAGRGEADKPIFYEVAWTVQHGHGLGAVAFGLARRRGKDKLGLSFEVMISKLKTVAQPVLVFPDWAHQLRAEDWLTPGLRESYRQTLTRFLEFCRQRAMPPAVSEAREFVELARLEQAPGPARLQEWKEVKGRTPNVQGTTPNAQATTPNVHGTTPNAQHATFKAQAGTLNG
jgi:hypothetical protein